MSLLEQFKKDIALKKIGVTRVDLRIPNDLYQKIEKIAEDTNQDFTPTTKNTDTPKRAVTPIILYLLKKGLDSVNKSQISEDFGCSPNVFEQYIEQLIENKIKELTNIRR